MRSIFKRFLIGAALVLTLTSCSSLTSYDRERQSFQYLTTENVIDSGSSNGVSYEVFLGDPERKSRKVYYFAESEDTYECILQTSFMNEYVLTGLSGSNNEIPSDITSESDTYSKYYHLNKNSIFTLSRMQRFKMLYIDISYTKGDEYIYINNVQLPTKELTYDTFKEYVSNNYNDSFVTIGHAFATMLQSIGKYGTIENLAGTSVVAVNASISRINMEKDMENTGTTTIFLDFYKSYLTEEEYETFVSWNEEYVIDWSFGAPGAYKVPLFMKPGLTKCYPYISVLPYFQNKVGQLDYYRELFYVDLYYTFLLEE